MTQAVQRKAPYWLLVILFLSVVFMIGGLIGQTVIDKAKAYYENRLEFAANKVNVQYTDKGDSVSRLPEIMQDPANVGFYLQNNTISGFKVTADFKVRGKVLFISPIPGETYERSYSGGNAVEVFGKFTLKIRRDDGDSEYKDVYGYLKIEHREVR